MWGQAVSDAGGIALRGARLSSVRERVGRAGSGSLGQEGRRGARWAAWPTGQLGCGAGFAGPLGSVGLDWVSYFLSFSISYFKPN